ncbi:MAG: hypothetical protein J5764_03240 [Bacteroidales bacterium]|nr:hypothetical protein [Bacteroidales bacterium]
MTILADIFRFGQLELPAAVTELPPPEALPQWGDYLTNRIMLAVAALLVLMNLRDFLRIFPYLIKSVTRPRWHTHIEHNMSMSTDRNRIALVLAIPFCLIADRFGLYTPSFASYVPVQFRVAVPAAALFLYMLLRSLMFALFKPRRFSQEMEGVLHNIVLDFFINLNLLILVSIPVLVLAGLPETTLQIVLYAEIGLYYLLTVLHVTQILGSLCAPFPTILYLCALELIPTGILIYSSIR